MKFDIKRLKFRSGLSIEFEMQDLSNLFDKSKKVLIVPHRTEFYNIIWVRSGCLKMSVDFKPIEIEQNSILFISKESVKLFEESNDFDGNIIIFTNEFFNKNANDIRYLQSSILFNDIRQQSLVKIPDDSSEFELLYKAMQVEFDRENDALQAEILRNYLHNLLLLAERIKRTQGYEETKASADLDYVLLFKELLDKNFKQDKSVAKYVSVLSISEKRLYNATMKILDKSPKELIDERVMLEAKRLLSYTNTSIKEIAYELGFEEPTNFIKYFRKHTSETPSDFRAKFQ
jgi:AraC-type DNA-binding domain-containing proteins